jgi:hypothetical protein
MLLLDMMKESRLVPPWVVLLAYYLVLTMVDRMAVQKVLRLVEMSVMMTADEMVVLLDDLMVVMMAIVMGRLLVARKV